MKELNTSLYNQTKLKQITNKNMNIYWQYFFYVTFLFTSLIGTSNLYSYSSQFLTRSNTDKNIKTYYAKHLLNLRRAVIPRIIHYIDSANYKTHNKFLITGILFTYKNTHSKKVNFLSNIDRFQKHPMKKNKKGVWYYILTLKKYSENPYSKIIQYKYQADGLYDIDSTHNNINANGLSVYYLIDKEIYPKDGPIVLKNSNLYSKQVIFRIYSPNAEQISILGNFNNWNSSTDYLQKTKKGYFEIKKFLAPGEYIYYYKIDGFKKTDPKNYNFKTHSIFGKVSYLKVQ